MAAEGFQERRMYSLFLPANVQAHQRRQAELLQSDQVETSKEQLKTIVKDVKEMQKEIVAQFGTAEKFVGREEEWRRLCSETTKAKRRLEKIDEVLNTQAEKFNPNNDPEMEKAQKIRKILSNSHAISEGTIEIALAMIQRHFSNMDPVRNISIPLLRALHNDELEPHKAKIAELEEKALLQPVQDSQYVSGTQLELRDIKGRLHSTLSKIIPAYEDPIVALEEFIGTHKLVMKKLRRLEHNIAKTEDELRGAQYETQQLETTLEAANVEASKTDDLLTKAYTHCEILRAGMRINQNSFLREKRRGIELDSTIRVMEIEAMERDERARYDMDQYGTWMNWDTTEQERLQKKVDELDDLVLELGTQLLEAGQIHEADQQLGQIIEQLLDGYSALRHASTAITTQWEEDKLQHREDKRLREREIESLKIGIVKNEQNIAAQSVEIEKMERFAAAQSAEIKEREERIAAQSARLGEQEKEMAAQSIRLEQKGREVTSLSTDIREKEEEIAVQTVKLKEGRREMAAQTARLEQKEGQVISLSRDMGGREEEIKAQLAKLKEEERKSAAQSRMNEEKDQAISKLQDESSAQIKSLEGMNEKIAGQVERIRCKDEELATARNESQDFITNFNLRSQSVIELQKASLTHTISISAYLAELNELKETLTKKDKELPSMSTAYALVVAELQAKKHAILIDAEKMCGLREMHDQYAADADTAAKIQAFTIKQSNQEIKALELNIKDSTTSLEEVRVTLLSQTTALASKTVECDDVVSSANRKESELFEKLRESAKKHDDQNLQHERERLAATSKLNAVQMSLDKESITLSERDQQIQSLNGQIREQTEAIRKQGLVIIDREAKLQDCKAKVKQKHNEVEQTHAQSILRLEAAESKSRISRSTAIRRAANLLCDSKAQPKPEDLHGWIEVAERLIFDEPVDLPLDDFRPYWSVNIPYDISLLCLDTPAYSPHTNIILLYTMLSAGQIDDSSPIKYLHFLSKHILTCDCTFIGMAVVTVEKYCSRLADAAKSDEEAIVALMMIQIYDSVQRRSRDSWTRLGQRPGDGVFNQLDDFISKGSPLISKVHQVIKLASANTNSLDEFNDSIVVAVESEFETLAVRYNYTMMVTNAESPHVVIIDTKTPNQLTLVRKTSFEISDDIEALRIGPQYTLKAPRGASLPIRLFQHHFDNVQMNTWWNSQVLSYGPLPPALQELVDKLREVDAAGDLDNLNITTFLGL